MVIRVVLVPLDGSALAEAVLPAAAAVAAAFEARVKLLHVIEQGAPTTIHGQRHLTDPEEAQAYLEEVARRPVFGGHPVDVHVHRTKQGDVAESLVDHAEEFGADLVALSTHGRGGLRGVLFGSIAMRALQRGTTPILLVHPTPSGEAPELGTRSLLVPLDGTPGHEEGLPLASALARAWQAAVHLEVVVPTAKTLSGPQAATGVLLPTATRHVLDLAQQGSEEYVERLRARLAAEGVSATCHVSRGDPATCLVESADRVAADLVVLASHARAALDAFWAGSLTPKVITALRRPILLVRAEGEDAPS